MIRDALYVIALLVVAYGVGLFYVIRLLARTARVQEREAIEAIKQKYLEGSITLDQYEEALTRETKLEEYN